MALCGASAILVASLLALGETGAGAASATVVNEGKYGFSFTLPVHWKQVPLNGSDVTALLNAAAHNDPTLASALTGEVKAAASNGIKVFGVGPVSGSTVANVNIIVTSSAGAPTGNAFASAAVAEAKIQLTQVGTSHIKTSIVHNRLGAAAQVTYELNLKGAPPQFGDQFYAVHKSHIEIITVTTSTLAQSQTDARLIVDGWHWK